MTTRPRRVLVDTADSNAPAATATIPSPETGDPMFDRLRRRAK